MQIPIWPLPKSFSITTENGKTSLISKNEFQVSIVNAQECEKRFLEDAIERFETIALSSEEEENPFRRVVLPPLRNESYTKVNGKVVFSKLTIKLEPLGAESCVTRTKIQFGTNESYALEVNTESGTLIAENVFGALRGIETFAQLISMSSVKSYHNLAENLLPLRVEDEPRFAWRGLLLDTARHFFSVDQSG